MSFGTWLRTQAQTNATARDLQAFADAQNVADWPFQSDRLGEYVKAIEAHAIPGQKEALLDGLGATYETFLSESSSDQRGFFRSLYDSLRSSPGAVLLIVFGLIVAIILVWGIFFGAFLDKMSVADTARGLITFLFAFTTIAIITLVAIATFYVDDAEDLKVRFAHAKDLITIVIGVLGTIIGFYFGSIQSDDTDSASAAVNGVQTEKSNIED